MLDATVDMNELDVLIEQAGKRGYLWHLFRVDKHGPEVLAGVFQWKECADVIVLTDDQDTHAYRTPTPVADLFAPPYVH